MTALATGLALVPLVNLFVVPSLYLRLGKSRVRAPLDLRVGVLRGRAPFGSSRGGSGVSGDRVRAALWPGSAIRAATVGHGEGPLGCTSNQARTSFVDAVDAESEPTLEPAIQGHDRIVGARSGTSRGPLVALAAA